MLSPFKNLLNQFFMPDNGQASIDDARSLQLATAGLLHVTHGEYIAAKLHARHAAQPAA